jgi:UDP-N-acetylglucosamine--N-acetylmuramyl-(pentapeptide) pyrophosphoryl-undecaprenol N-acetylglucosamine transferase
LAVLPVLKQQCADLELLWVGSQGGLEQGLVRRAGLEFAAISATGLRGKNPLALLGGVWRLNKGYQQSREIIRRFQPDALFVTGGYVCVPTTLAAWRKRVPSLIYLPDIEPGLAIKFLARFASRVAVTAPEAQQFFKPGLAVVTGYPVRAELFAAASGDGKAAARRRLGLTEEPPVLLVFGGSRGARSINQAITAHLETLLKVCQIMHVTGTLDETWVQTERSKLSPDLQSRYHVSAYLHDEMVTALAAADLVVSRAGASILGEFPAVGLPAILVPYPYAGAHQTLNAAYLVRQQAAVLLDDTDLNDNLESTVIDLLSNHEKLYKMSQACRNLARPEATLRLAQEILGVKNHG